MGRYPIFQYQCGRFGATFEVPEVFGGYGDLGV